MRSTIRIAALALVLAALAVLPAGTELRAHTGDTTLIDLTVTADGGTAQTLVPAFHPVDDLYTVWVANSVSQVTIAGTPDGDGVVTYQYTDADTGTDGHQVNLPTLGPKSINVGGDPYGRRPTSTATATDVSYLHRAGDPRGNGGDGPGRADGAVQQRRRQQLDGPHQLGEHGAHWHLGSRHHQRRRPRHTGWPLAAATWLGPCRLHWATSTRWGGCICGATS